ncbi:MAG TPA: glycine cleavage system aminomethyltransferase GcvT [Myxococcota bacterium]|nr:glycine cleavage system aminomethyltransferase GcvT [Myxococcota bacterium]
MSAQKTPLYYCHEALKAHMVTFANTWMPLRYDSEKEEHLAVRNAVGLFDVSHMGEFMLEGNVRDFLQKMLTRDIYAMKSGKALYALMLNERAGIIEDLIVYCLGENSFMLCVNAANIERDWQWLSDHASAYKNLSLLNVSNEYAQLALQGKNALSLLSALSSEAMPKRFWCKKMSLDNINCLVARTGYTGEDGVEIFVDPHKAEQLWHMLLEKGRAQNIKPCGLAARDSLRLEAGLLLHGTDINDQTTPLEAHLDFAVDKQNETFIGKLAHDAQILSGTKQSLVGFRLLERGVARHGFTVLNQDHQPIGTVTSGSWPPTKDLAIGLAMLEAPIPNPGTIIYIDIRNRAVKAEVTAPRFL